MENLKLRKDILKLKKALLEQYQQNNFASLFLEELKLKIVEKWGLDEYNRILSEIQAENKEEKKVG